MVTLEGQNLLFENLCLHKNHYSHFPITCEEKGCDFNWQECRDCILHKVEYDMGKDFLGLPWSRDLCFVHWHCGR